METKTALNVLAASGLIIALSVGYYYLSYLPQLDKQKTDLQAQQEADAVSQADYAANLSQQAKTNSAFSLSQCLYQAGINKDTNWQNSCTKFGLETNCALPSYNADFIMKSFSDDKSDCFRQYPQN